VLLEAGHDHGCDVWGVGIVTYVLLTGHLPFSNETKDVYLKQTKKVYVSVLKESDQEVALAIGR